MIQSDLKLLLPSPFSHLRANSCLHSPEIFLYRSAEPYISFLKVWHHLLGWATPHFPFCLKVTMCQKSADLHKCAAINGNCFSHTILWAWSGYPRNQIIITAKYVFGATFMASFSQLLIEYLTLTLLHILRAIIFHYVNNIIAIYQFFMFLFFPVVKKDLLVNEIVPTFSCSDDKVHLRRRGKFPFPHSLVHLPF